MVKTFINHIMPAAQCNGCTRSPGRVCVLLRRHRDHFFLLRVLFLIVIELIKTVVVVRPDSVPMISSARDKSLFCVPTQFNTYDRQFQFNIYKRQFQHAGDIAAAML